MRVCIGLWVIYSLPLLTGTWMMKIKFTLQSISKYPVMLFIIICYYHWKLYGCNFLLTISNILERHYFPSSQKTSAQIERRFKRVFFPPVFDEKYGITCTDELYTIRPRTQTMKVNTYNLISC